MNYTNTTINLMNDELKETLVWSHLSIEVAYDHDNDNFKLIAIVDGSRVMVNEFDKSAEAVKAAQLWLLSHDIQHLSEKNSEENKMIYSFHQNNSFGVYHHPAKNIIVKDARDVEHAKEIALSAGMYLNGVASGKDCDCCGDRWYGLDYEFNTVEEAIESAMELDFGDDSVPMYIVVDDLDVEDTVLE